MSDQAHKDRDELDRLIARYAKAARSPEGVPAPGATEPSDDDLLRVIEGSASAEERARVAAGGPFTRERLEILKEALAEAGHTSGAERAARYVFAVARDAMQLLRSATEPVAAPVLAGHAVRGSAAAASATGDAYFEFDHDFDDVHAVLRVEHVPRDRGCIDLQVRVERANAPQTRVTILRGGQTIDSTPVDDRGLATFAGLEAVRYRLELRRAGRLAGSVILDFIGTDPEAS